MGCEERRINNLIKEVRQLTSEKNELKILNNALMIQLHTEKARLAEVTDDLQGVYKKCQCTEDELKLLHKKFCDKIKQLKTQIRQNDIFRKVYRGSSKTVRETMVNEEMEKVRKANEKLEAMIRLFSRRVGVDSELLQKICMVADGTDDPLILNLVKDISNVESLPVNVIDVKKIDDFNESFMKDL